MVMKNILLTNDGNPTGTTGIYLNGNGDATFKGNVWIWTTNPSKKLDVNWSVNLSWWELYFNYNWGHDWQFWVYAGGSTSFTWGNALIIQWPSSQWWDLVLAWGSPGMWYAWNLILRAWSATPFWGKIYLNGVTNLCDIYGGNCQILWAGGSSSQWTNNWNDISYISGNVGIGTENPTSKLDVKWATSLKGVLKFDWAGWDSANDIEIYSHTGRSRVWLLWYYWNSVFGGTMWIFGPKWVLFGTLTWAQGMQWPINTMYLSADGKLGIWTENPTAKLEVKWGPFVYVYSWQSDASICNSPEYYGEIDCNFDLWGTISSEPHGFLCKTTSTINHVPWSDVNPCLAYYTYTLYQLSSPYSNSYWIKTNAWIETNQIKIKLDSFTVPCDTLNEWTIRLYENPAAIKVLSVCLLSWSSYVWHALTPEN